MLPLYARSAAILVRAALNPPLSGRNHFCKVLGTHRTCLQGPDLRLRRGCRRTRQGSLRKIFQTVGQRSAREPHPMNLFYLHREAKNQIRRSYVPAFTRSPTVFFPAKLCLHAALSLSSFRVGYSAPCRDIFEPPPGFEEAGAPGRPSGPSAGMGIAEEHPVLRSAPGNFGEVQAVAPGEQAQIRRLQHVACLDLKRLPAGITFWSGISGNIHFRRALVR